MQKLFSFIFMFKIYLYFRCCFWDSKHGSRRRQTSGAFWIIAEKRNNQKASQNKSKNQSITNLEIEVKSESLLSNTTTTGRCFCTSEFADIELHTCNCQSDCLRRSRNAHSNIAVADDEVVEVEAEVIKRAWKNDAFSFFFLSSK